MNHLSSLVPSYLILISTLAIFDMAESSILYNTTASPHYILTNMTFPGKKTGRIMATRKNLVVMLAITNRSEFNVSSTQYRLVASEGDPNAGLYIASYAYNQIYYSRPYKIVGTIYMTIIFVVGFLGNIMVVVVVLNNRALKTPTNCYLVSLAVADCMSLVAAIPEQIISLFFLVNQWVLGGRPMCSIIIFAQYLGINASALSITAFTLERYLAICYPLKAHIMCTFDRAQKIVIGVWIFSLLYSSPWLFLTTTVPMYVHNAYNEDAQQDETAALNQTFRDRKEETGTNKISSSFRSHVVIREITVFRWEQCTYGISRDAYLGYYMTDLFLFYLLPLTISFLCYGMIVRILVRGAAPPSIRYKDNLVDVTDQLTPRGNPYYRFKRKTALLNSFCKYRPSNFTNSKIPERCTIKQIICGKVTRSKNNFYTSDAHIRSRLDHIGEQIAVLPREGNLSNISPLKTHSIQPRLKDSLRSKPSKNRHAKLSIVSRNGRSHATKHRKASALSQISEQQESECGLRTHTSVHPNRQSNVRTKIQVIKMLVIIVLMFAILWVPYRFLVVYNSYANPEKRITNLWYKMFSRVMVFINSAANPLLYSLMSVKFRHAFRKLLIWPSTRKARRFSAQGNRYLNPERSIANNKYSTIYKFAPDFQKSDSSTPKTIMNHQESYVDNSDLHSSNSCSRTHNKSQPIDSTEKGTPVKGILKRNILTEEISVIVGPVTDGDELDLNPKPELIMRGSSTRSTKAGPYKTGGHFNRNEDKSRLLNNGVWIKRNLILDQSVESQI